MSQSQMLGCMEGADAAEIARAIAQGGVATTVAAGCAIRRADGWRIEKGGAVETPFDLASLTKPMTALAIARLAIEKGARIERGAPLVRYLPELRGTASEDATIEMLLAHRAGLLGHVALHEPLLRGEAIDPARALRDASNARREDARGTRGGTRPEEGYAPVYSDLGYILAGAALARVCGTVDAAAAIDALVVVPLGLERSLGSARALEARGVDLMHAAAPTERVDWRGGEVRGRVHDENAWALTGAGGSGHAGMFGTISAVLALACAFLDALEGKDARLASDPETLRWLVAERPGGTLRAGFDGKSGDGSSAGARAGARTFGHLGFTGTSVWIDPDAHAVVTLLTNRVHPTRENTSIRVARPIAHDALFVRGRALR